jgi:Mn2+/Fe2+ NRAMP family transporter
MAGLLLLIPSVKVIAQILGGMVAVMGIVFLASAIAIKPPVTDMLKGMTHPIIPVGSGGGLLVLGLIGTTVVPYNLFLGSGLSTGQSVKEMRSGLLIAIILGGIISMAVLVTGTTMNGNFSFEGLADSLTEHIGKLGYIVLGVGLLAAGFTSAVTAPLASAVTVRSLFGNSKPELWKDGTRRFRAVWISILVIGMGFGMVGFKPIPVIIIAQALNGLILPLIAVFLFITVNNRGIMNGSVNRLPGNMMMTTVVFITLMIGLTGIVRTSLSVLKIGLENWGLIMLVLAVISFLLIGAVLLKISNKSR